MKAVLLSIQPKWCELIASGRKTIEVRKTRPQIETPFKCYIYATKGLLSYHIPNTGMWHYCEGQEVIGEFVCDRIDRLYIPISTSATPPDKEIVEKVTCLSFNELKKYADGNMFLYGWRISDLKIYDKPKELGEFFTKGECQREFCAGCKNFHRGEGWLDGSYCDEDCCIEFGIKPLTRPPQSWCYVEELQ